MPKVLIVIVGPTASGKTELAIAVARKFKTEIVSADSRQIFKELNIGVSRPAEMQLAQVKHHLIAVHSISEEYTAGMFEREAITCLGKIFSKHDYAVMAGGSGLYVKAVCQGLDAVPAGDAEIRTQLEKELSEKGLHALQDELKRADPVYYDSTDIKNPRRVLRALEVFRAAGRPFSSFHDGGKKKREFGIIKIGLMPDRKKLYDSIHQRVDAMMKSGLMEEARSLIPFKNKTALQTVGYQELFSFFDGETDLESAVNLIKQNTRNYARRQLTWFRKEKEVKWFDPSQRDEIIAYITRQAQHA